jgi:hypothetical protein
MNKNCKIFLENVLLEKGERSKVLLVTRNDMIRRVSTGSSNYTTILPTYLRHEVSY